MEVLNAIISEADHRGVFVPLPPKIKHHASVYADDLVILLSPCAQDFSTIRHVLDLFAGVSGLSTNVDKCIITPICCSNKQMEEIRQIFPCKVQDFPTKYLGAALSLSRICRGEEQRLVDAVAARIPTWKAGLLTNAGQATLTQMTLSAIPIHIAICYCLSAWAIKETDRRHRAFL
jgi:hypothetical protein